MRPLISLVFVTIIVTFTSAEFGNEEVKRDAGVAASAAAVVGAMNEISDDAEGVENVETRRSPLQKLEDIVRKAQAGRTIDAAHNRRRARSSHRRYLGGSRRRSHSRHFVPGSPSSSSSSSSESVEIRRHPAPRGSNQRQQAGRKFDASFKDFKIAF